MSLDKQRIIESALAYLKEVGFNPDAVPFLETGKSAIEHIVDAVANAVLIEIKTNAVVKVELNEGLAALFANGATAPTDGGSTLLTTLTTAASTKAYDKGTGTIS